MLSSYKHAPPVLYANRQCIVESRKASISNHDRLVRMNCYSFVSFSRQKQSTFHETRKLTSSSLASTPISIEVSIGCSWHLHCARAAFDGVVGTPTKATNRCPAKSLNLRRFRLSQHGERKSNRTTSYRCLRPPLSSKRELGA